MRSSFQLLEDRSDHGGTDKVKGEDTFPISLDNSLGAYETNNFDSLERCEASIPSPFESKLRGFFLQNDPDSLREIPKLLARYKNRESLLFTRLEAKYSPRNRSSLVDDSAEPIVYNFAAGAFEVMMRGPLNILMLATPFAFLSNLWGFYDSVSFCLALLSIAPFAERLGYVTEQISLHTSDTIGGLLNATFGNATELIISIEALNHGLYRLVQLSLLGSVLSNLLLVLGSAFLFGGMRFKSQKFDKITSLMNSTMLMLGVIFVVLPTVMQYTNQVSAHGVLSLSRISSMASLVVYSGYMYFQLVSHPDASLDEVSTIVDAQKNISKETVINSADVDDDNLMFPEADMDEGDDEEDDILGVTFALFWLSVITVIISLLSDIVVNTIEKAAEGLNIPAIFIATIVVPIIGNAAEHASAIVFAFKNKLNITLGVAVGSSTQIGLMVLPLLVVIGYFEGRPLTLCLGAMEGTSLMLSILIVMIALKDGVSNWLLGLVLIVAYLVIATAFWFHDDESLTT